MFVNTGEGGAPFCGFERELYIQTFFAKSYITVKGGCLERKEI